MSFFQRSDLDYQGWVSSQADRGRTREEPIFLDPSRPIRLRLCASEGRLAAWAYVGAREGARVRRIRGCVRVRAVRDVAERGHQRTRILEIDAENDPQRARWRSVAQHDTQE